MKALRSLLLITLLVGVTWISSLQYHRPTQPSSQEKVSTGDGIDATSIKREASEREEVSPEGTPGKLLTAVEIRRFRAVPQRMENLLPTLLLIATAILAGVMATWWRSVSTVPQRKSYQSPKIIYESTCDDPNNAASHRC